MAPGYYAYDNNRHRYFSSSDTDIPDDAEPDTHVVTEDLPPPRFPEKPKSALQKRRGGDSGRVVAYQEGKSRQKSKAPKLCAGCGAQVIFQRNEEQQLFKTGVDAVDPTLSKKQAKLARYYDTFGHKHNTENPFLCERCIALKSENIWKAYDALHDVEASVFRNQISHIVGRRRWGLCIMVVDATDPEHSAIKKLRDCIGKKTAVWIAINKIDLVPRMSPGDQRQLRMRIENISDKKTIKCFAVSAKTGAGVLELAEAMLANLRGQDVFVVGSANVGKSSLVQRMTCTIARGNIRFKGRQGAKRRDMLKDLVVTGSHLPGTTLQAVRVPCFPSIKHALWDTPGIINRKALQYSLFPTHLMEPLARPEPVPVPTR
jgi:GTP-binding protein EngB required for normal cell division